MLTIALPKGRLADQTLDIMEKAGYDVSAARDKSRKLILADKDAIDKKVVCVGTTSVRTVESLYWHGVSVLKNGGKYSDIDVKQWDPYQEICEITARESLQAILDSMDKEGKSILIGQTQLMIVPGYDYRIVKGMITNFHQPKALYCC